MAIVKGISVFLLIVLVVFLVIQLFYLPMFLFKEAKVELSSDQNGEMVIMSTNVRCYSPEDTFKKSWFYRAHLIVEDINTVKPDIIGFQEVSPLHYDYLVNALVGNSNPNYDSTINCFVETQLFCV